MVEHMAANIKLVDFIHIDSNCHITKVLDSQKILKLMKEHSTSPSLLLTSTTSCSLHNPSQKVRIPTMIDFVIQGVKEVEAIQD